VDARGPHGDGGTLRRRRFRTRRRALVMAAVAAVAIGAALAADAAGVLHDAELKSVDLRFQIRGERTPRQDVVLVAVDNKTLSVLNRRPPYPRSLHARMIDFLHRSGARVIGYDIQFVGTTTPDQDGPLIAAVKRARPMVLATHDVNGPPLRIPAGVSNPASVGATLASVGVPTDSDAEIRQMYFEPVDIVGFDAAVAAMARHVDPDSFPGDSFWIDFAGPPHTVPTYSFSDVLLGHIPAKAFADKVVVVGYTDPILNDVFKTPVSDTVMSGPEVHVNAIDTILDGFPLTSAPEWDNVLVLILAGTLVPVVSLFRRAGWTIVAACAGLALLAVLLQLAFDGGLILNVTRPTLALAVSTVGSVAGAYVLETRERRRMRQIFTRFVPRDVVNDVIERTDDDLRLGAVRRDGTVMFTDLRGFTTFSEQLEPEQVVEVINQYLSEMTDAILRHGGTLVSYMGDGIMALFGAPLEQPDHADRALLATREMIGVRLPRFNQWLSAHGFDKQFRMGIGVNSGQVMSGNVGSIQRLEYTALGDTTNTAARLEAMTKGTEHQAFIADSTRRRLSGQSDDLLELGDAEVRGRSAKIKLWTLREDPPAQPAGAAPAGASGISS
jgi:adenylate cyclase